MAKSFFHRLKRNLLLIGFICFLCINVCNANSGIRLKLEQTYSSEIGVRELTGRNDGKEVEKYLASCNRKKGDAWCAAFVNWCLKTAGAYHCNSGWSPSWFPATRTIYIRGKKNLFTPQQGDVFGIYFTSYKRIAHVGFIDHWGTSQVITVEGNTSAANTGEATREGEGVYRKRRLTRQIYAVANWIDNARPN